MKYQRLLIGLSIVVSALGLGKPTVANEVVPAGALLDIYRKVETQPEPNAAGAAGPRGTSGTAGAATHRVLPKESLSAISRRYKLSVQELMKANGLRDPNTLRVGQVLRIPGKAATTTAKTEVKPQTATRDVREDAEPRREASTTHSGTYKVRSLDTLSKVAGRHGITVRELAQANGLSTKAMLKVGQILRLPTSRPTPAESEDPAPQREEPRVVETSNDTIQITGKDTFYALSKRYKITVNELRAANPNVNPNALKEGQRINIPVKRTIPATVKHQAVAHPSQQQNFVNPHPSAKEAADTQTKPRVRQEFVFSDPVEEEEAPRLSPVEEFMDYRAVAGDTWDNLAPKFNTTKQRLREINGAGSFDELKAGDRISVPMGRFREVY